ncbi:unnamed protein product [Schistosoma rodhaini]|uniref:Major facilitator superfamily (MFS) profile domain-containing protein n=3 Tax=Schistosoma rodhaini TaxID=6188 RepID=A0AA85GD90_9TREM|nr:unnamed protein product [Schistosoma rodhaini]CAH8633012.1 unnamed protein product [Schistosoma rodhaini]
MVSRRRLTVSGDHKPEEQSCWSKPTVYHAAIVIFLEFFAFGLLTTPMISVLDETFPKYTFLMNGIIHGVKGILSFLSAPFLGALSDMFGRKPFLLLTVTFTCSPIPLMKISHWWYFTMISISGIFAVTFSFALAYVADITSEEDRSWGYGLVSATFAASLVSSPAIGAYLGRVYSEELVVALATAIAFLDICFILACVPESLSEKVRIGHLCSVTTLGGPVGKFSWGKADPFATLRQMTNDHLVLMICITTFLSYLPEAGQYSCFFVYLRLVMGFTEENVALFIAVVGIMSCIAQTLILSLLNRIMRPKRVIIVGLIFEAIQLTLYGFVTNSGLLWSAGLIAATGSITYPALSTFISTHAAADQQGVAQGLITGIRGLCNGLGPALFGLFFYIFRVDLNEHTSGVHVANSLTPDSVQLLQERLMPGPPFAFGAILVLLAILVAIFIPENHTSPELTHSKIITDTYESTHGASIYGGETRLRRSSPSGQSHRTTTDFDQFTCGLGVPNNNDSDKSKLIMSNSSTVEMSKYNLKSGISHNHPMDNNGIWNRLMTGLTDFRNPIYIKQRPNRVYRQSKSRFSTAGIVEPFRRLFIRKIYDGNIGSCGVGGSGGGGFLDHEARLHYSRLPFTVISSSNNNNQKYLDDISKNDLLFSNPLLLNPGECEEAADLSNYRAHHFRRMFITPNTTTSTTPPPLLPLNNDNSIITTNSSQNYTPTSSLLITSNKIGQLNSLGTDEEDTFMKHCNSSISPIISPTSRKIMKQKFFTTNSYKESTHNT